jgi:hypothetical protein
MASTVASTPPGTPRHKQPTRSLLRRASRCRDQHPTLLDFRDQRLGPECIVNNGCAEYSSNAISAEVLNAALESLGLTELKFEAIEGKPVLRKAHDELSLEKFIGLLLACIGSVHLQRVAAGERLAELEQQLHHLRNASSDPGAAERIYERIQALVEELRRSVTEPVIGSDDQRPLEPHLTIGQIQPEADLGRSED